MSGEEKSVEEQEPAERKHASPTIKGVVFAVCYSVFLVFFMAYGEVYTNLTQFGFGPDLTWPAAQQFNFWQIWQPIISLMLLPILVAAALPGKYKFTMHDLAFIYSMIVPAVFIGSPQLGIGVDSTVSLQSAMANPSFADFITKYLSPLRGPWYDYALLEQMVGGQVAVPWSAWTSSVGWHFLYFLSILYFSVFASALIRRQVVDVEELPFPLERGMNGLFLLSSASKENKKRLITDKLFLLAFVIGFVFSFILWCGHYFATPELNLEAELTQYTWGMKTDFTQFALFTGALSFWFTPENFALGLLQPIEISLSVVAWYLILYDILPPIFVAAGQMNAIQPGAGSAGFVWWDANHFWSSPQTIFHQGYVPFTFGVMIAIGIFPLIKYRSSLVNSMRSVIGAVSEPAESEALPYRYLWLGFVASGLLFIVAQLMANVVWWLAILMLAWVAVIWLGIGMATAQSGLHWGGWGLGFGFLPEHTMVLFNGLQITDPAVAYPALVPGLALTAPRYFYMGTINMVPWSLSSFQLGKLTGTDNRTLFVAQLVGVTLSTLIAIPLTLYLYYTYGYLGRAGPSFHTYWWSFLTVNGDFFGAVNTPNEITYAGYFFGFAFTFVLYVLQTRLPFLRFVNPVGALVATFGGLFLWFPYLLAAIIKAMAFRVGGAQLYQSKIYPIAIGLLAGYFIVWWPRTILMFWQTRGITW